MPISFSDLGGGGGGGASEITWVRVFATYTTTLTRKFPIGLYKLTSVRQAQNGTSAVAFTFKNSSNETVASGNMIDVDSGNTLNPSEKYIYVSQEAASIDFLSADADVFISIEQLGLSSITYLQLDQYTTSQDVVIDNTFYAAFAIGGGGGGGGNGSSSKGGSGGGSGYIDFTTEAMTPGVYPLVIGAGGPGAGSAGTGSAGGSTTFNGLTANGGNGGGGNGGPGGSGGSGGGGGASGFGSGGSGGSNGSNGGPGTSATNGGIGSLVQKPEFATIATNGGGSGYGGGGGGFYGGGGGGNRLSGSSSNPADGGSAAAGTGGGGGGAGTVSGTTYTGGTGGTGSLWIVRSVTA